MDENEGIDRLDALLLRAVVEGRIDVDTAAVIGIHADRLLEDLPPGAEEFPS